MLKFLQILSIFSIFNSFTNGLLPNLSSITNVTLLRRVLCIKQLHEASLISPVINNLLGILSISEENLIDNCVEKQENIENINEEGQKYGYTTESNDNVFFNQGLMQKRMGYNKHSSSTRRKRSIFERTFFPPIYPEDQDFLLLRSARNVDSIPKSTNIDYQNHLGPAEDQGLCACCYAHTATAMCTNFLYNLTGTKVIVSVQELVDCSGRPKCPALSNNYCQYGHYDECAIYLHENNGINLDKDYPFKGVPQSCRSVPEKKVLDEYYVEYVPLNTEYEAYMALKEGNVVGAAICATDPCKFYKSGILNGPKGCECTSDCPNHAVAIVGLVYDEVWGMFYWLLRNSWGTSYGDNGYFRMRAFTNCGCIARDLGYYKFIPKTEKNTNVINYPCL